MNYLQRLAERTGWKIDEQNTEDQSRGKLYLLRKEVKGKDGQPFEKKVTMFKRKNVCHFLWPKLKQK